MTDTQKVILSIFKEIKQICERHNIKYYAIGGTCIGAVRHKGFIPWDDDIDIAIPIEQYFIFLDYARKELPDYLYVLSPKDTVHYPNGFSKICDNRTMFIMRSSLKYPDSYKGVFIDVMPISGVPEGHLQKYFFCKTIKFLSLLNKKRRFGNKFVYSALKLFPYDFFSSLWFHLLRKHPLNKSVYTGYVWWPAWVERLVFPTSYIGEGVPLDFEDTTMNCPMDYHSYLLFQFGDYMTPPPVSKQITHNGFIDLRKSYRYYQEHPEDISFPEDNNL